MASTGTGTGNLGGGENQQAATDPVDRTGTDPQKKGAAEVQIPKSLSDVIVEGFKALVKLWHVPEFRKLLKSPWLYTVVFFLASVSVFGWHFGIFHMRSASAGTGHEASVNNTDTVNGLIIDSKYIELARKAIADHKPYFIEAVTLQYDIDDLKGVRNVSWRNTYTVRALKDITPSDHVFLEIFNTEANQRQHWAGTEHEEPLPGALWSRFYVDLSLSKGETRTFTTGVDLKIRLPLANDRVDYARHKLQPNEDFVAYPNDEDYVGNVLVIVRSKTTAIRPNSGYAAVVSHNLKHADQSIRPDFTEAQYSPKSESNGWYTVSKEWSNLPPGDELAVFFEWPNR